MNGSRVTLWSVLGAIVAILIAWALVSLAFHLIWFVAKLVIVAVVAVLVYFALRGVLRRPGRDGAR